MMLPEVIYRQAFINGQWCDAQDKSTYPVNNPANGEVIAHVSNLGEAETLEAIDAARQALPAWQKLTAKQRSQYLQTWYQLIVEQQEPLARLLSLEQGKPLAESRGEILYGASFIEWFAEEGKRTYGETIPSPLPGRRITTIKQPIGVVAAITPWNFPNAMITRKVAPALAAGCTVVLKPAPETPLSALILAALAQKAGIPDGVFNVVTGTDAVAIGRALTQSPVVRKLSFTGSTHVGKLLMAQCASTVKKMSLELGGNAPFIVFDDADLDAAVTGALTAKFRNSGQTCVCANRLLVQDTVYDAFSQKLAKAVATLQAGPALEGEFQQGPLINAAAVAKVQSHIDDAKQHGAQVLTGGQPYLQDGFFFQPTVLTGVTENMLIANEETFGPVAPLIRFHTEEQAIQLANQTESGLAAYFYSRDIGRIVRVAEALECGMVGINEGAISNESAPFGGIKQSGLGREGSRHGIEDYMEIKYLCFGSLD
ncbi:NAD-dependent succinate-semialdehyde dehydrogenase [Budviciaceae bacterium CWB-B4]|uniref:NAD-dependent succinate-semialdehyde dehydrogenase n=1 Tax=Limnobaculum xujianqingii TaxID=2738837 RepID=A0A9D7AJ14_9GAMM|nr:NAD-dependent succinate-semialdehyde dehydrogenase [Limnobaculum xujianqingii]MBK5073425.1 NAD-dependent succinate-semialdehyde dehydrogenase [Limnobaculum xujianqingii]MBK5176844.1 NAD-dependent succinate-semialdehyde dehydrogenase [Limnobaculum xujianqingii]